MNSSLHKSRHFFCAKYAALLLGSLSISANAAVLTFGSSSQHNFASYSEAGFVVTPSNSDVGIEGPVGNFSSLYLDFNAPYTTVTVTSADSSPFDLTSLDIGTYPWFFFMPSNVTINALVYGGGTLSTTYNNVTALQNVTPNWSNITSFTISSDIRTAVDNIVVSPSAVPEPGSAATALVLASGMIGLVTRRRRR